MSPRFRVWAPDARTVELELDGLRIALSPGEGGWWSASPPGVRPESDYRFALDGGEALPDPRSPWQPHGAHGPSRTLDHAAFAWSDAGFQPRPLAAALLYELHVGTFTLEGTFDGAVARLDHLAGLGVTHVELMPVHQFSGERGWGYDGVLLYAPHHAYGGPQALKRLVDACHARGLAVLLDVVWNHLGPEGNVLERFAPYFTDRYATPWGKAVNLDGRGSDEVRRFLVDNALQWLRDYHVDGLRVDAVHAFHDRSATHLLEELAADVEALSAATGRHFQLVAESDLNDPRLVARREAGGYGLDAQWSDDFHHALHAALTGERQGYYEDFGGLEPLARALTRGFVYDGRRSRHRGRRHGRPATGLPGHRFVAYLQNHDQVGNRARGERLGHLVSPGRARVAAALLLAAPFVPLLFQGEEWGASSPFPYFTDHLDEGLGAAVREGRRREFAAFGWRPEDVLDPQNPGTFARARLDWEEPARPPHAALLEWYRRLVRLRRAEPDLADGRLERVRVDVDEAAGTLVVRRGAVVVAANLGEGPRRLALAPEGRAAEILLASPEGIALTGVVVELPPDAVAIARVA